MASGLGWEEASDGLDTLWLRTAFTISEPCGLPLAMTVCACAQERKVIWRAQKRAPRAPVPRRSRTLVLENTPPCPAERPIGCAPAPCLDTF